MNIASRFISSSADFNIVTKRKESYAVDKKTGIPNILIDDRPKNLERWIARGGVGIGYQANEDSLDLISKSDEIHSVCLK